MALGQNAPILWLKWSTPAHGGAAQMLLQCWRPPPTCWVRIQRYYLPLPLIARRERVSLWFQTTQPGQRGWSVC